MAVDLVFFLKKNRLLVVTTPVLQITKYVVLEPLCFFDLPNGTIQNLPEIRELLLRPKIPREVPQKTVILS
jgi:hypothetical protein